ncbi:Uncharacterised protein [Bordetella pertussis]|nr:Uncharacterised protein [Bordetella pertussis]
MLFLDGGAVGRIRDELRFAQVLGGFARVGQDVLFELFEPFLEERQLAIVHVVGLGHGQQFLFAGQINRRIARRLA